MKFTRDNHTNLSIRRIERGALTIGEETFTENVALTADSLIRDWPELAIDQIDLDALERLLNEKPEVIVLGTGWQHRFPPRDLMFGLARRGIGLEVMDTPAACRTFNILVAEGRRPAALLLID
ncbi:MAG: MTH938/NDUFAF3 family protein [Woeseia sp.]